MSPLAAIRQWVAPEVRQPATPSVPEAAPGATVIPPSELRAINPDLAAPIVNPTGANGPSSSFGNVLGRMVEEVNSKQVAANQSVNQLVSGQNVSLHQTVLAMEEANISFQLMVEVRNKLLDSYQELMRMQI